MVLLGENGQSEDTDLGHMTSKPLTKGAQYVKSGSVSNIMDTERDGHYYVKAKVDASMRNEQRIVHVTLSCISGAVRDASCTCPGSALGRCNHVAALLLMLDKHIKEFGHNPQSCTSKECEWNKGKRSNKNPQKVAEAVYPSYKEKRARLCDFDPRPATLQKADDAALNSFVHSLKYSSISRGKTCMWESLLEYKYVDYELSKDREGILKTQAYAFFLNLKEDCQQYNTDTFMIPDTESQSDSIKWKANRWFRITASVAKQANNLGSLVLGTTPYADLTYRKMFNFISNSVWDLNPYTSPDMQYGIENEDQARSDYVNFMKLKVPEIKAEKTGFWVNILWPELGCSPDGLVTDPSEADKYGLLEIKCPKIFRKVSPKDLFKQLEDKVVKRAELYSACFGIPQSDNVDLELKTSHMYYFQIQFQLAITGRTWCDFVLWSPLGHPNVERIRRDEQLITTMLGNVTSLWNRVVAPEIFEMRVPRKLNPVILE